jgi:hypothetical protein
VKRLRSAADMPGTVADKVGTGANQPVIVADVHRTIADLLGAIADRTGTNADL